MLADASAPSSAEATLAASTPAPTPPPSPEPSAAASEEFNLSGGGARLIVNVQNETDNANVAKGRLQLNKVPAPRVGPVNIAIAQSIGCADCQTLAVALQISVYRKGAPFVAPQNAAVAANGGCLRCFTMAVAIQYLIPTTGTMTIPPDVRRLAHDLNGELAEVVRDEATTIEDRLPRLFAVIDSFRELKAYVDIRLKTANEADSVSGDPIATPLPATTDDPAATLEPSASPETPEPPTATPSPQAVPTSSPEPSLDKSSEPPPTDTPSPPT
jgi:hypothetical protein